jgi:hypothetical protein
VPLPQPQSFREPELFEPVPPCCHVVQVEWKRLELPMGCATDRNPELREVGIVGGHAYSVLSVREVRLRNGGGTERLVHVRNPHGVGEWNGDWSDRSAKWAQLIDFDGERTGVDDGTFWIDWTHFLMGFALVEVSTVMDQSNGGATARVPSRLFASFSRHPAAL